MQEIEHGEVGRQRTQGIEWSSSDPAIATVVEGVVVPVRNGRTTITANVGSRTATATVVVEGMSVPFAWSFRNHVEPLLAKEGCNSGACHGRWPEKEASGSRCGAMIRRPTISIS